MGRAEERKAGCKPVMLKTNDTVSGRKNWARWWKQLKALSVLK